jgi:hypothetical protein
MNRKALETSAEVIARSFGWSFSAAVRGRGKGETCYRLGCSLPAGNNYALFVYNKNPKNLAADISDAAASFNPDQEVAEAWLNRRHGAKESLSSLCKKMPVFKDRAVVFSEKFSAAWKNLEARTAQKQHSLDFRSAAEAEKSLEAGR